MQALEGPGVVASARKLIGVTNPLNAEAGTIRGDFAIEVGRNVVHGSDSPENGLREIGNDSALFVHKWMDEKVEVFLVFALGDRNLQFHDLLDCFCMLVARGLIFVGWNVVAGLWFDQDELVDWEQHMTPWLKE